MSNMDQKKIIQRIVDTAVSVAEPGWLELVVDFHVEELQSEHMCSYLVEQEGKKVEKSLPVPDGFSRLLRELRDHLASGGKEPFSSCRLHLQADGKFDLAYGYGKIDWKQLMLKGSNFF